MIEDVKVGDVFRSPMTEEINLNVGGKKFTTCKSTIMKFPKTTLAICINNERFVKPINGEYFFDRNGTLFEFILDFYRTGTIRYPTFISPDDFEEELEYWGIDAPKRKRRLKELVDVHRLQLRLSKCYLVLMDPTIELDYRKVCINAFTGMHELLQNYIDGREHAQLVLVTAGSRYNFQLFVDEFNKYLRMGQIMLTTREVKAGEYPKHELFHDDDGKWKIRLISYVL